jgi:alcohol dehydrogenase class IV
MPFSYGVDKLEPAFEDRAIPYIAYGDKFDALAAQHIPNTLNASRAYIVCSTSLAKNTDALKRLEKALEHASVRVVGTRTGFLPHTRWNQVVDCAKDCKLKNPDVIITLGAGSLTDAVKVICWMLANNVMDAETLDSMNSFNPNHREDWKPPTIRQVAIPTSLSGGEYQSIAGVTKDDGTDQKCLFTPPAMNPSLVILDPELTMTTPASIWLSTGVRAIDHCVETLCSLQSNQKGDTEAEKGLRRLVPGLIRTKHDPKDLDARFETMMGVIEAMSAVGSGVPLGASHAIGHQVSKHPPRW